MDSPLSNLVNCGVYLFEMGRLFAELSNADSSMDVDEDSNNGLQRSGGKGLFVVYSNQYDHHCACPFLLVYLFFVCLFVCSNFRRGG